MVSAQETTLQVILEGTKQYQVPLYQRTYSWGKKEQQRLWRDVVELADTPQAQPGATHFIGSLVLAPTPDIGPAGVNKYLVVDGQQRLTTLTLLLAAIRDHQREVLDGPEAEMAFAQINEQYLINKFNQGLDRYKLLPTQGDRAAYQAVIEASPHAGGEDAIGAGCRFFRARLAEADDPDDPHDIPRIQQAVLGALSLVSVTTQQGENVHRIFESLNNTGLKLTQGDLLRNYLFMRLPTQATSSTTPSGTRWNRTSAPRTSKNSSGSTSPRPTTAPKPPTCTRARSRGWRSLTVKRPSWTRSPDSRSSVNSSRSFSTRTASRTRRSAPA